MSSTHSKSEAYLELADGRIVATYNPDTGELLGIEDWNGNEAHYRWEAIAKEEIDYLMGRRAQKE